MVPKLVRDLMTMTFKMLNGKSDRQQFPAPSSDPDVSEEDDGHHNHFTMMITFYKQVLEAL